MRKFDMSALAGALPKGAMAGSFREVCVPLYLELPPRDRLDAPGFDACDAEEARVEAGGITIGGDDDDDDAF